MSVTKPGLVVLLGSGETLPSSGKIHEYVVGSLPERPSIVILETPAGFEPNSDLVAGKIKEFLERRLQNYRPAIEVLPARRRGSPYSPDNPEIVSPILTADEVLLGPGSPTYAVRQLRDSLALQMIMARHRRGAALFLSSSATLAFGSFTIPVYEIYKVGEDLHWQRGLDYFGQYGMALSVVPHWNNRDGGEELDTSRCYIGQDRFRQLLHILPVDHTVVGVDEHTALILDFEQGCCHVRGNDSVTILRSGQSQVFRGGTSFPLDELGSWHIPEERAGIPEEIWEEAMQADAVREAARQTRLEPPVEVKSLLEARAEARANNDWGRADALRAQMAELGWEVMDTQDGSELRPKAA